MMSLAQFYSRQGNFDKTIQTLEVAEAAQPDRSGGRADCRDLLLGEGLQRPPAAAGRTAASTSMDGIAATDRSLALKPDYVEALTYKNLLLRMRANLETDPFQKQQLIAEADALRSRAIELNKGRRSRSTARTRVSCSGRRRHRHHRRAGAGARRPAPVRVGGNIKTPTKVKDVRPVVPAERMAARIQGVVILEARSTPTAASYDARVLRSIPAPRRGRTRSCASVGIHADRAQRLPVPVIMTVTVNFTLQYGRRVKRSQRRQVTINEDL